jgi:hypothetical protein
VGFGAKTLGPMSNWISWEDADMTRFYFIGLEGKSLTTEDTGDHGGLPPTFRPTFTSRSASW